MRKICGKSLPKSLFFLIIVKQMAYDSFVGKNKVTVEAEAVACRCGSRKQMHQLAAASASLIFKHTSD